MRIIMHRRNTIDELRSTPHQFGVEIDVRTSNGRLILHHDPFEVGDDFEEWLTEYRHGTLILNVKEEGLEAAVLSAIRKHDISDFFFLDQSFPFLIRTSNAGESRCAVRVSEYEPIDVALALSGRVDWVWVDCFTHFPLSHDQIRVLQGAGLKLCLVSPELQGRPTDPEVATLRSSLQQAGLSADAVCTKRPDAWQ